jgi:Ser/Thr protein kinase RdoA (MazF antagonist)
VVNGSLLRELNAWDRDATVDGLLGRGARNEVWAVSVRGAPCVARRSARSSAALGWELDLLEKLRREGVGVPATITALDGRRHVDGLVVTERIEGHPPATTADWVLALAELRRVHEVTRQCPQRPTFAASRELLSCVAGGDIDLDIMPPEVVEECRTAWRLIADEPASAVHGDPGAGNILINDGRAMLIDWDESRVDASVLDLAALPFDNLDDVVHGRMGRARSAADAWETAVGWVAEPEYALRRLSTLRERRERQ